MTRIWRGLLLLPLRLYRYSLASLWPGCCRFEPSCSLYAQQALGRYGLLRGGILTLRRLGQCHPWHPGGHDPVP